MTGFKQPLSVLVVIHTPALEVLLLERAAHPGFWQSVTGSREDEETLFATACREVIEETGIDTTRYQPVDWQITNTFEIFAEWRHRYAPGVTRPTRLVFLHPLPVSPGMSVSPEWHRDWTWMPWQAAAERCFSWSNRDAILLLPQRLARGS